MVVRSAVHITKGSTKNRSTAPPPSVNSELPELLRQQHRISFDKGRYDLHGCVVDMLTGDQEEDSTGEGTRRKPIGSFRHGEPIRLENLCLPANAYRDKEMQAELFRRVTTDTAFLEVYTRLLHEVVVPHLVKQLEQTECRVETTTPRVKPTQRGSDATSAAGRTSRNDFGVAEAEEAAEFADEGAEAVLGGPELGESSSHGGGDGARGYSGQAAGPKPPAPAPLYSSPQLNEAPAVAAPCRPTHEQAAATRAEAAGVAAAATTPVKSSTTSATRTFYCQFPPTLRLQPGPATRFGRPHNDAEYGHQVGEVNFWLPLTDFSLTRTALWVESLPGLGDFAPLDMEHGTMAAFHGTLCQHHAEANPTGFTRASLDFRVGVGDYFDHNWVLRGTKADHGRIAITTTPTTSN